MPFASGLNPMPLDNHRFTMNAALNENDADERQMLIDRMAAWGVNPSVLAAMVRGVVNRVQHRIGGRRFARPAGASGDDQAGA